jgi:hypothetical protein
MAVQMTLEQLAAKPTAKPQKALPVAPSAEIEAATRAEWAEWQSLGGDVTLAEWVELFGWWRPPEVLRPGGGNHWYQSINIPGAWATFRDDEEPNPARWRRCPSWLKGYMIAEPKHMARLAREREGLAEAERILASMRVEEA